MPTNFNRIIFLFILVYFCASTSKCYSCSFIQLICQIYWKLLLPYMYTTPKTNVWWKCNYLNKYDETLNILCILLKGGEKGRGGEERGWGRGRGERRGHDIDTKPCMILAYRHANDFDGVSEVSVTFRNGLHTIAAPRSSYQHRIGTSCAYHIGEQIYPSLT